MPDLAALRAPGGPVRLLPDRGSSRCRPPPRWRRARGNRGHRRPLSMPPIPITGTLTSPATRRTWSSATGRTAGPERPPLPAPSQGSRVPGSRPVARSVLISDTASAPPSSAASATAAGSAVFGVSFTISGFSVSGRRAEQSASVSAGCSPTIRPDLTFGQETLSSIAATSSRSPTPATSREKPSRRSPSPRRPAGRAAPPAAAGPLPGSPRGPCSEPDGVDHPARGLIKARRRIARARLRGDRLRDEGGEREPLEQGVAECPPSCDRVERAGAVQYGVLQGQAADADHRCPAPATSAVSISSDRTTGPSTQSRM